MKKSEVGAWGEETACRYLEEKGFEITARNFYAKIGEIDIIAQNETYIVFVEVKTRAKGSMVSGIEAVTPQKMRKLFKTALVWLDKNPTTLQPRFDVIEIISQGSGSRALCSVEHIENAFGAEVCHEFF